MIAVNPATTALLVVDMQNDFCEPDGFYSRIGTGTEPVLSIVPPIDSLLQIARHTGAFVLFTAITYQPEDAQIPSDLMDLHSLLPPTFKRFGPRLITGSWGAQVTDRLAPLAYEVVIEKPGYSAFFQTQTESILRRRNIETILLTGVATNGCVLHSAFDAFVRDFDVVIIRDAVASYWPELHDNALQVMGAMIGPVVSATEAEAALRAGQGLAAPREINRGAVEAR